MFSSDYKVLKLYGLPRIYKGNVPLRPIVSATDSPCCQLAKFSTNYLKPYKGKTNAFVEILIKFIQTIKNLRFK